MARVLVISDLQAPFQHKNSLSFLSSVYNKYDCNKVVCIGDEFDFHFASKYAKDPDGYSNGDEYSYALRFMEKLYKLFPNVLCCTSNHTVRPWLRAFEIGLPKAFMKTYNEALHSPPGWIYADEHFIDKVKYIHGELYTGRQAHMQAVIDHGVSVVHGHVHGYGGCQYIKRREKMIFGMNVGCLVDQQSYAMKYGIKRAYWGTLGCGVVIDGEFAQFVPLIEK